MSGKATGCDHFRSSSNDPDISACCRDFRCQRLSLHYHRTRARSSPLASTVLPELATLDFWKQNNPSNSRVLTAAYRNRAFVSASTPPSPLHLAFDSERRVLPFNRK